MVKENVLRSCLPHLFIFTWKDILTYLSVYYMTDRFDFFKKITYLGKQLQKERYWIRILAGLMCHMGWASLPVFFLSVLPQD